VSFGGVGFGVVLLVFRQVEAFYSPHLGSRDLAVFGRHTHQTKSQKKIVQVAGPCNRNRQPLTGNERLWDWPGAHFFFSLLLLKRSFVRARKDTQKKKKK